MHFLDAFISRQVQMMVRGSRNLALKFGSTKIPMLVLKNFI